MKKLLIISALIALAWWGSQHQAEVQRLFGKYILKESDEVEYAKCTTADGDIIYGSVPFAEKCRKIEIIKKRSTVVPTLSR